MLICISIANRAMTAASQVIRDVELRASEQADARLKIAGLAVAALLPAIFWTLAFAVAGGFFGFNPSPLALAYTGAGIALFLTAVCAPLIANA